jgi:hypothetical protein
MSQTLPKANHILSKIIKLIDHITQNFTECYKIVTTQLAAKAYSVHDVI